MMKPFLQVLSVASVLAIAAPLSVSADAPEVNCRVPFEFSVEGKTLQPGRYTVSTQSGALLIRGREDAAFVLGSPTKSAGDSTSRLVFEKYRDTYTLREVWMGGRSGRELPLSQTDRERRQAARNGEVERIVIAGI